MQRSEQAKSSCQIPLDGGSKTDRLTAMSSESETSNLARFSVSLEKDLLTRFLRLAKKHGWHNRSEALRHLMRDALVQEEWSGDDEIVGTITLVYDHHKRELVDRLTSVQHDHHEAVLAATHIHLDHDNCLEMIAVKGRASRVQKIADALTSSRGIKHGKLSITTTGRKLK
jgi:CopG family transcriptional regulator, nickel-responsive regulator